MRKDVNLGLLLLIVAALLMFSGFTVYYQTSFKNLSTTYQNELNELDRLSKELASKRAQLNETSVQLQLKSQKEDSLSKKYVDTSTERDQFASDKTKLQADLTSTKTALASAEADLKNTVEKLGIQQKLSQDLQSTIDTLKANVAQKEATIASLDRKVKCLKDNAGDETKC